MPKLDLLGDPTWYRSILLSWKFDLMQLIVLQTENHTRPPARVIHMLASLVV